MNKKKAKLIFKHNYFEIIEDGDHVLCAISGKKIPLQNLSYWDKIKFSCQANLKKDILTLMTGIQSKK